LRVKFHKKIEYLFKNLLPKKYQFKKRIERAIRKLDEPEIFIINKLIEKETDCIDVGVYRGVHSYEMSKYSKCVHAFEPNPVIFHELEKYLPSIISNIKLYNYALSDQNGKKNLKIPIRDPKAYKTNYEEYYRMGLATIHEKNTFENFDKFEIKCMRLDDLKLTNKISFIKIDVEGHEIEVLNGGKTLIQKFKPNLMIEIEQNHSKNNMKDSISFICSFGYQVYCLKDKQLVLLDSINNQDQFNNFIFKSI
tara:strand:- start:1265 stop:2017 length:753 start_codon:yes stop_codon:yes gene_type:complete